MSTYVGEEIQHSTRLQLETDHFPGESFQLKKNHPLGNIKVKILYKIETEKKPTKENIEEEKPGEQDFPPQYSEIKEGKRELDETKAPEWMDAKIKIKEINIAKEVLLRWLEQEITGLNNKQQKQSTC